MDLKAPCTEGRLSSHSYRYPHFPVLKSPQPGSCGYFPFITAVDNSSESATLNHFVTASAPPLANSWKFILGASWTTSFSRGGKLLPLPRSQEKNPHTNRRQNEKSTGEGEGPISSGKPSRRVMGKQPACAKWKVTPCLLAATSMFVRLAWMYLSPLCPQSR